MTRSHSPRRCPLHQNEFSPEALGMWLESYESNGLGVLLTRAELSGMLRGIEADTKRGRGTAEAQFLESYDGDGCTSLLSKVSSLISPCDLAKVLWARKLKLLFDQRLMRC